MLLQIWSNKKYCFSTDRSLILYVPLLFSMVKSAGFCAMRARSCQRKKNNANSGVWRVNAQNMVNTCKYMLHVDTYRYQRFWQVSTQKPQTSLNYIRHRHFVKPINLWHLAIWHPTCLGLAPTVGLPALKTAANCEGIKAMPLGSLWHGESMYCAAWALGQQQCLWIFTRLRPAKSF